MKRALLGASLLLSIQSYAAPQPDTGVFSVPSKDAKTITVNATKGTLAMTINKISYIYTIDDGSTADKIQAALILRKEIQEAGMLQISYKKGEDWKWEITDITTYHGDYKYPRLNRVPSRRAR